MEKAIVLLSGGLDSAVALSIAIRSYECIGLCFDYGQRHRIETVNAVEQARYNNIRLESVKIEIPTKSTLLTKDELGGRDSKNPDLPSTFVPARNLIFISIAAALAYSENAHIITGGWNAIDYSGYPDCRRRFLQSIETTLNLALGLNLGDDIRIDYPLVDLTKASIIKLGLELKTPFEYTWSCYAGKYRPCGVCDSCRIRAEGFRQAGVEDPALILGDRLL